ncbi:MAG: polyphenol oxidase family protein [Candidatus Kerfeldbacteria bacterium]|nr:polyphenol oxidase family protein [Candidatus Kerfeldbacteria bacterium]
MSHFPTNKIVYATSTQADGSMSFKWGGPEAILRNRELWLATSNLKLGECVCLHCQHADQISIVNRDQSGRGMKSLDDAIMADAVFTRERRLGLMLLTADCIPVAVYDPDHDVIGLIHLGWKSTDLHLADKSVGFMNQQFQSVPSNLLVSLGPAIHQDSYRFSQPTQKTLLGWGPFLRDLPDEETAIDLIGYNLFQLRRAGVLEKHIAVDREDTGKSKQYFSHFRAKRTGESEGRFATVLALR